jgi:sulfatase maturation enzyme AslB (radical SAM superfamily)
LPICGIISEIKTYMGWGYIMEMRTNPGQIGSMPAYFAPVGNAGSLYPCHHFYGNEEYKVGHVKNKEIDESNLKPYRIPVSNRSECQTCFARYL